MAHKRFWFLQPASLLSALSCLLLFSACANLPVSITSGGNSTATKTVKQGVAQITATHPPTATSPAQSTTPTAGPNTFIGTNLIVNGNAEAGPGTSNSEEIMPLPGWTRHGPLDVILYDPENQHSFIAPTDPGPSDRGKNYFWGGSSDAGNLGSSAVTSITQTIDLSTASTLLASGKMHFTLTAWLGGYLSQDDNARLTSVFLSASGQTLGTTTVGPVLAKDRNNAYGLLKRSSDGVVPGNTTKIIVTLTITRVAGSDNDGSADDLSLILHP